MKNEPKEITMMGIASTRRSSYGMTCVRCGDMVIAPERSEYVSDGQVRHLWRCSGCNYSFEISIRLPETTKTVTGSEFAFVPSLFAA